jgi:Domain of unknown function (DUF1905)/Bacteriocin-protection, YdeI or OmpD-Associated
MKKDIPSNNTLPTWLVDNDYLLEKFPGKGGWTYASIPEIAQNKENPFGWVQVSGFIDTYELKQYKLMPMGNGTLFLPVKAEIRKKLKKEAGSYVRVKIYIDESAPIIPEELLACLKDEPLAFEKFQQLPQGQQKQAIDFINQAKKLETKIERITELIEGLLKEK